MLKHWTKRKWKFIQLAVISKGPIYDKPARAGWENGLVQNNWQAIILTNDYLFYWHMYHLAS